MPHLTSQCYFPWFGIQGCRGEDARAMLRLTNSALNEANGRIVAGAGWYSDIRSNYAKGR